MKIEVYADPDPVAHKAATIVAAEARNAVVARGRFLLAVSGGHTPWLMLRNLAGEKVPWEKGTFEDYVGKRALDRKGKKKWRECVADVVAKLAAALEPDDVVLGGGNVKNLKELPPGCRAGDNANAFLGGFRLWAEPADRKKLTLANTGS